jgi:hypothetical protein
MPFIALNKASDPTAPDDLRINSAAILYVEASRPDLVGLTTVHVLGQGAVVIAVNEPIDVVVREVARALEADGSELLPATRHYLAPPPGTGPSTVFISPVNVSFVRPNLPASPDFWVVHFTDGSEVRVVHPLPGGL